MRLSVRPYDSSLAGEWSALIDHSNEGTLFHRLDFLSYHGNRFSREEHHLLFYNGATLCGIMPVAVFEENGLTIAKSPYGGSYGGPAFDRVLNYADSLAAVKTLLEHLRSMGVHQVRLTMPIRCCYRHPSDTFKLALLEHGFVCASRDISSVVRVGKQVDLNSQMEGRARNMARKAEKEGVQVKAKAPLSDFWTVLEKTYQRLGLSPTHTTAELNDLNSRLGSRVFFDVAYCGAVPVAGLCHFVITERVDNSFYLAQDSDYLHTQSLTLLISKALAESQRQGFEWFDFGTSSANQHGRANLFQFKESFGAVGQFRETYLWTE